jgi:hypothetical protein
MTDLEDAYAAAFEEWEPAGESRLWDKAVADDIGDTDPGLHRRPHGT